MIQLPYKTIGVGTDFSPTSENAIKYADNLARAAKLPLELIHVFHPVSDVYEMGNNFDEVAKEWQDRLEESLQKLEKDHQQTEVGHERRTRFLTGFPVEKFEEVSKEEGYLLVLGTTGEGGILDKVFGRISIETVTRADGPVMLVPAHLNYQSIKTILFATEHHSSLKNIHPEIMAWREGLGANLICMNVNRDIDEESDPIIEPLNERVTYEERHGDDVVDTINEYVDENEIDLLIMTTRHRTFFQGLFHPSTTRRMVVHTTVPIVVLHEKRQ